MKFSELVTRLGGEGAGSGDPDVREVHIDSRRVEPGTLFCALPGTLVDGARYVGEASERGAAAILSPAPIGELDGGAVTTWVHADARRISGEAAALVHEEPSRSQRVIGVTGTNGKTTVVHLIAGLLRYAGLHPGTAGTIEVAPFGASPRRATHTTPDSTELQRICRENLAAGGDAFVLEASSHALDQERLAGMALDLAVYTNIGLDHLDYHGDLDTYAGAKARIFGYLKEGGGAVINSDADRAEAMIQAAEAHAKRIITFGSAVSADLRARVLDLGPHGTQLELSGMGIEQGELFLPLTGRHNVENGLAALASVLLLGVEPEHALAGAATLTAPRGRLEEVDLGRRSGFQVFVDYAHTPDALERVLTTLRDMMMTSQQTDVDDHALFEGRLICVFGCGGNRDREKRGPMGEVVGRLADLAIVTNDNPRFEDPGEIISAVREGLDRTPVDIVVEPDRRTAIRLALREAEPGDVVLIAGKGHEAWQLSRGKRLPFEDARVVLEELP